jgi:hypothetical protein
MVTMCANLSLLSFCVPIYLYGHYVWQAIFMATLCTKLSLWPLCVLSYLYGRYVYQVIFVTTLCTKLPYGHSVCQTL